MSPDTLRTKMQQLGEFISDAEESVRAGKLIDLTSLDGEVTTICQKATSLPPAQAAEIQPAMADLIGRLERLAAALAEYKQKAKT